MAFAEAMELEKETLFNVLLNTPVVVPVISNLRHKLENSDYEANFLLKWMQKDLHPSSISAYEKNVPTPNLNSTKEIFAQAKQQGYGNLDFSDVYDFLNSKK